MDLCAFLEQNPDGLYYWVELLDSGCPVVPFDATMDELYRICVHYYALVPRKKVIQSVKRWLNKCPIQNIKLKLIYSDLDNKNAPDERGFCCIEMGIKTAY
jgi:hypothetical protein